MKLKYEEKLLNDWEDIYRQGLLTFWIFLVLDRQESDVSELRIRISELTKNSYNAAEQSLYRVLRKHYDLELVDVREVSTKNGPNRKIYSLSKLGKQLLHKFAKRNITLFSQPEVQLLIRKGDKK